MRSRRMFIVAGPPGGGKSSFFALSDFADHVFNADDRAAELNSGSYENIPTAVRTAVNREFEDFVHGNIRTGTSFALETTLRSTITFPSPVNATPFTRSYPLSSWLRFRIIVGAPANIK